MIKTKMTWNNVPLYRGVGHAQPTKSHVPNDDAALLFVHK